MLSTLLSQLNVLFKIFIKKNVHKRDSVNYLICEQRFLLAFNSYNSRCRAIAELIDRHDVIGISLILPAIAIDKF